ncbi:MAG: hypothetical protein AAGD13_06920 [Pseudomonadota bacterium]
MLPSDAAFIALAQQLGYSGDDEHGAMAALLQYGQPQLNETLGRQPDDTILDEILSLHWFHALSSDGPAPFQEHQDSGSITTFSGTILNILEGALVDFAPSFQDPRLLPDDIDVSNGLAKVIDAVLLPFDVPDRSAVGLGEVLVGTDSRDRLFAGGGNDLLVDGAGRDMLRGGASADTFFLSGDGSRDKVLDFELGQDVLDLSNWDVGYLSELYVKQRSESSLLISDGQNSVVLQAGNEQIRVEDLGSDSIVFPDTGGIWVVGTDERDHLYGTGGDDRLLGGQGRDFMFGGRGADTFWAGQDAFDVIMDFDEDLDRILLWEWGVTEFQELEITQFRPGTLRMVAGGSELRIRAADREIAVEDLSADNFILIG